MTLKEIYQTIRTIIMDNEPNADDEFFWLNKIFENLPF